MVEQNKAWATEFEKMRQNPPVEPGTVLTTIDGSPVAVHISLPEGKKPFFYGIVYLASVVGQPVGWYARSINDSSKEKLEGIKLIVMTKARNKLLRQFGIATPTIPVKSGLKVHHKSESGKSILVELVD